MANIPLINQHVIVVIDYTEFAYRHVSRYAYRHVSRNAYRHASRNVHPHASRNVLHEVHECIAMLTFCIVYILSAHVRLLPEIFALTLAEVECVCMCVCAVIYQHQSSSFICCVGGCQLLMPQDAPSRCHSASAE